jgi:peptidoglycan/LPS O-acetylase OafA/YrhL
LLNTFDKILFVTGMGIVLHLVYLKKFSFIKNILTFKIMTTISRSTYGIYMLHLYFISLFFSAYDNNYYVSLIDFTILNFGIFIFTWIVSFSIGLIIESPLIGLSKKFLRNEKKK